MSTTSATEAARQPNGELDPANAGLGAPEAKPPTWEEAVAHAKVLREQGVNVRVDERLKAIDIRNRNGKYHDPADGTPAFQTFHPDGKPKTIDHYTNGELNDPDDGTPAVQEFYPNGTPMWIGHYCNGELHDLDDGTPAWRGFYPDGTLMSISHWTNGELISEERFPPPIGEV